MTDRTMDGITLSPPVAMVKRRAARAVLHPNLLLEGGPLLRVQLRRVRVQVRLHYVDSDTMRSFERSPLCRAVRPSRAMTVARGTANIPKDCIRLHKIA